MAERYYPKRLTTTIVALGAAGWLLLASCGSSLYPRSEARPPRSDFPPLHVTDCKQTALFCNVVRGSGLDDRPRYGRGVAIADVNRDGDEDIFIADTDSRVSQPYGLSGIYLGKGGPHFERAELGLEESGLYATWGGAFGDYDNDNYPDLLITNGGFTADSTAVLYHNEIATNHRFRDVTAESGIGEILSRARRWWGSSWADYDRDGYLDLAVASLDALFVFHNEAGKKFTDATHSLGLPDNFSQAHTPVWTDVDGDGDPDLFVPEMDINEGHTRLFINRVSEGKGFVDETSTRIGNIYPDEPGTFAAAAWDFNMDGCDDIYLGRWTLQDLVLVNDCTGHFSAHGRDVGIDMQVFYPISAYEEDSRNQPENTMGLGVGAFDSDLPHVYIGTGNPYAAFDDIVLCTVLDSASQVGFRFERCSDDFVSGTGPTWGHGMACGDFDHDGDNDVVIGLGGHPETEGTASHPKSRQYVALFDNRSEQASRAATIELIGEKSPRDPVGAKLSWSVDGSKRTATIRSAQGFSSQNSKRIVVDTGRTGASRVEIEWPSGLLSSVDVRAGTDVIVYESGRLEVSKR
jgi:hypothetical protein